MKNFFTTLKQSVYGPKFYSEVIRSDQSGFGYFFKLIALASLIYTAVLGIKMLPLVFAGLSGVGQDVSNFYPRDLIINWKDGAISTNQKEPYIIPMSGDDTGMKLRTENLIVIDTKSEASLAALKSYKTTILVTKNAVVYMDSRSSQARIQDLTALGSEEFVLTRQFIDELINTAVPYLKKASPLLLILVYFMAFIFNAAFLLYALFAALLVLIVGVLRGQKFSYGRAYQTALYLMTMPLLVTAGSFALNIVSQVPRIPFQFTILFVIAAVINLTKKHATSEHHAAPHPSA